MKLNFAIGKPKSITKHLQEKYGGNWRYDRRSSWWCDDNKRWVSRVAGCQCDDDCSHSPVYYLYGDGSPRLLMEIFYETEPRMW